MNRMMRTVLATALLAGTTTLAAPSAPVLAAAELTMTKAAPSRVLAGEPVEYELRARNVGDDPIYNVSLRDVLPPGVSYVPGSTSPASAGDPDQIVDAGTDVTTLIWSNVADIQAGGRYELTFDADPDPAVHPVGSTVTNSAGVYGNEDPRFVPDFDALGVVVPGSFTGDATSPSVNTAITAIEIEKSEDSSEGELLRGVHTQWTVYTLNVRTTSEGSTDDVIVTDFLPAELEFLGCGGVDNTTVGEEYPGSGPLGAFTVPGPNCLTPVSVETVLDPAPLGATTFPSGVYTRVQWNLGTLPADSDVSITYAAGIPLRANGMFDAGAPSAASLGQAANLDNNTGPSTREPGTESSLTNIAHVGGDYQGPVLGGDPALRAVEDDDDLTREIEDVRMAKSALDTQFIVDGIADYQVRIDTSEYASADAIVVTDIVPNGLCPLGGPVFAGCTDDGLHDPSVPFSSVTFEPSDGTFTLVFDPIGPLTSDDSFLLTYSTRMRSAYAGGVPGGLPVASGDSFTNTVSLTATTTPIAGTGEVGDQTVIDASSATLVTDSISLDKTMLPRGFAPDPCPTAAPGLGDYADSTLGDPDFRFGLGDRVCFRLRVSFAEFSFTRNPVVTDFLPAGVEYIAGSATATSQNDVAFTISGPVEPTFVIGDLIGGERFVDPGDRFDVVLAARIVGIPDSDQPDVIGNLMKLRVENTAGEAVSLRDELPFEVAPAPQVDLTKGIAQVDSPAVGPNGPNVDGATVREGSRVTFRIDITNDGDAANGTDVTVRGLDVWDVLPAGIACSQVDQITNFTDGDPADPVHGDCLDPADGGYPLPVGSTDSVIRWQFPTPVGDVDRFAIDWEAPNNTRTLTYRVTMPSPLSAGLTGSLRIENTAGVRTFDAFSNDDQDTVTFTPADNIDTTLTSGDWNAGSADDISWVVTPQTTVNKSSVTSINQTNNNVADQAVIGERVTYTYSVNVPAYTTVFNGVLSDPMPTNLVLQSVPAPVGRFYPNVSDLATSGALPGGFTLSAAGTLTFPASYTNSTATVQRFEVDVVALVTGTGIDTTSQVNRTNTARFRATSAASAASPYLPDRTAARTVQIRQPVPTLVKSNDAGATVRGGDTVTYTLTASNQSGRPPLHDVFVVDCIPAPLVFDDFVVGTPSPTFGPSAGDPATNGCAVGSTYIAVGLGTLAPGASAEREYTVTVPSSVVGGDLLTNSATLRGGSLDDGQATPQSAINPDERIYSRTSTSDIEAEGIPLDKSVTPSQATIGETVTYTLEMLVPANQTFPDLAIVDTAPVGLTSITLESSDCVTQSDPEVPCSLTVDPATGVLGPLVDPPGGDWQLVAFSLGQVAPAADDRLVTVTYTAVVADIAANLRGVALTNSAVIRWNGTPAAVPPSSPLGPWNRTGGTDTASVTVEEPEVSILKSVDDATPAPGDQFTYTLVVTNSSVAFTSDAHLIEISDVVPVGVVVDVASISDGGSYDAGSRTITWSITGPLAPGGTVELDYDATLADSSTLGSSALVNTASVDSFESLPTGGRVYSGNSDTASVTPQFPRLSTDKTVIGAAPVYIGDEVAWRIVTTNVGDATAFDIVVTDTLPENWTYVAGSSRLGGNPLDDPTVVGRVLTWTLPPGVTLDPTESLTIDLRAIAGTDVPTAPGVGSDVAQVNETTSTARDGSGASENANGPYEADDTASTRIDAVDLLIDKTGPAEVVAGTETAWQIVVSNPTTANTTDPTDVAVGPFTVVDTLPSGVEFVSAAGTGWSCSYDADDHEITCSRTNAGDTLAADAAFPAITVTVSVDADVAVGTTYTNTASVDGRTHEVAPADNTDDHTATTTTFADLRLVKSRPGDMTATAGLPLTYAIDVSNLGPSTARSPIVVTDPLPAAVTFDGFGATDPSWSCAYDAGDHEVTCTRATDLADGSSAPQIEIEVTVNSDATGTLVNDASVGSPTPDPVPTNNDDDDSTPIVTSADLRLTKSSVDAPFVAGETGVYRLRVDNDGPSDAAATVTIVDDLPAGLTYAGSFTSVEGTWTCADDPEGAVCTLDGPLAVGTFATVEITVDVAPDLVGPYTNSATVSTPTDDPNPDNDTDTDSSGIDGEADLVLVKTGPATAVAGTEVSWTLQVTNAGPSDSVGPITVVDTLPAGTRFVGATGDGWLCGVDQTGAVDVVTCISATTLVGPGSGAPTAATPITVTADIDPSAGPATLVNQASVTGTTTDTDPGNNDDTHDLDVTDDVELTITKTTTGADPVRAGESTEFRISVTNAGPSTADLVQVVDTLPSGLLATAASGTDWTCDVGVGATVTCERATLLPGATAVIDVTAIAQSWVPDGTTLTNSATTSTTTPGDDPDDNTATSDVDVIAEADLAITKSHEAGPVLAGADVTFTIAVENLGPSDAVGPVTITDTLPDGFTYVGHQGPWTCTPDDTDPVVVCTLDSPADLVAGTSAPALTMVVALDADLDPSDGPDTYVNSVTVTSTTDDPEPDNDSADDPVDVAVETNVSIVKTATGPARVGDELTFTLLVRNDGPSVARDVAVSDDLDPSLQFVSATGDGWTCGEVDGQVDCTLDAALDPEAEATIAVTVVVTAAAYPTVSNTATVTTSTPDSDPDDNTSTTDVDVPAQVDLAIDKSHEGEFVVGEQGTYTLTVVNNGPTSAPGPFTVVDQLPIGLSAVSATPADQCAIDGDTVTCELVGPLDVGAEMTVTLVVEIAAAAAPSVTNTATVTSPSEELSDEDNTDDDVTLVTPVSELALDKRLADLDGTTATWAITVTNIGPSPTWEPIVLVDDLPVGLEMISVDQGEFDCTVTDVSAVCVFDAELAVGESVSVQVVTRVTAQSGTEITNTASVEGGGSSSTQVESTATVEVPRVPSTPTTTTPTTTTPGSGGSGGSGSGGGSLPFTGSSVGQLLLLAGLLVSAGLVVRRVRRPA